MIAIDTSSFVAYLEGGAGKDVEATQIAIENKQAVLPPVVLTELLSGPGLPGHVRALFQQVPLLEVHAGYWERAGILRAQLLTRGHRTRVADSLIAQSCLDHDVALITRDMDFRHFVAVAGLKVMTLH